MLEEEKEMVDKIKTTWRIPKDLVKKFKHLATDRETYVTTLVIQAMKEYLERNRK
jgi:predicted transcriptional regulator